MRSGTCPFISPFMDKRIFLPKESTRHSSLDKKTMKNNNNLVQSRSQFWQTRAINVMVCKWVRQRKGTLYLSYLIKSLQNFQKPKYKNKKLLSCRTAMCQRELVMGKVIRDHICDAVFVAHQRQKTKCELCFWFLSSYENFLLCLFVIFNYFTVS